MNHLTDAEIEAERLRELERLMRIERAAEVVILAYKTGRLEVAHIFDLESAIND